MAKELLKEAIADAKAVREVALQNAKMALEEAFDSKIKNMLSAKLSEEIEDDDELEETYMEDEKEETSEAMSYDEDDMDMDEAYMEDDKDMDEEINLDELMAELEETSYEEDDDSNEGIMEDEGGSEEDFDKLEKALGENSENSKNLNESLAVFALIGGMIATVGGHAAMEHKLEDKEWAAKHPKIKELVRMMSATGSAMSSGKNEGVKSDDEEVEENIDIDALIAEIEDEDEADLEEGATGYDEKVGGKGRTGFDNKPGGKGGTGYDSKKVKKLKEERNAAIATVRSLKESISEMNLLNSKLLYCNKLFRSNALTEAQKVKVVDALDMANTANEAKLVFTTLQESFNFTGVEKRSIREGLGRSSKASGNAPKKVITESVDETVSRFQKLANIKF